MFRILNPKEEPKDQILSSDYKSSFRKEVFAYGKQSHDIYIFSQKTELQIKNAVRVAENAPVFPKVWAQIEPLIEGLPLVAHNKPFDEGCLKAVFKVYQMDYPDYEFYDTLAASRRAFRYLENHQLHTVAAECGYCLENHHHALADAEACAWIAREIL